MIFANEIYWPTIRVRGRSAKSSRTRWDYDKAKCLLEINEFRKMKIRCWFEEQNVKIFNSKLILTCWISLPRSCLLLIRS